jgi:23S rRNA (cytosine1962-C5)-methyltransferase
VLATAEANRRRNGLENIRFREADVFDLLAGFRTGGRQFDTMVLDPPAFAKTKAQVEGAVRGYKELNLRALQLLAPGGTLITCSCSHHVSETMLLEAVAEAGRDARRNLRVLERRVQAQDHPVLLGVPETLYLKCLILQAL